MFFLFFLLPIFSVNKVLCETYHWRSQEFVLRGPENRVRDAEGVERERSGGISLPCRLGSLGERRGSGAEHRPKTGFGAYWVWNGKSGGDEFVIFFIVCWGPRPLSHRPGNASDPYYVYRPDPAWTEYVYNSRIGYHVDVLVNCTANLRAGATPVSSPRSFLPTSPWRTSDW